MENVRFTRGALSMGVYPVEIGVPELPGGLSSATIRLPVWNPTAGSSYTDAGPFFNGQL